MANNRLVQCPVCETVVELLEQCGAEITCCGRSMPDVVAKTQGPGWASHLPILTRLPGGLKVTVGAVEHPMQDDHRIEWIEVIAGSRRYRHTLGPGEKPEALFVAEPHGVIVRAWCSLHGLWQSGMSLPSKHASAASSADISTLHSQL